MLPSETIELIWNFRYTPQQSACQSIRYAYAMIVPTRANQLLLQLLMGQLDTLPSQCIVDTLNIRMKEFGSKKHFCGKIIAMIP